MFSARALVPVAALLLLGVGCKKDGSSTAPTGDGGKPSELILGKWVHEDGDTLIMLEFAANKVEGRWKSGGSGPSMSGSYSLPDANTVEMPKFGGGFEEKVKIESLTKDKLVLSGFSYKSGKFEFTRPGAATTAGPTGGAGDTDRVMWIHPKGRFNKTNATRWDEDVMNDEGGTDHWTFAEAKRTPEYVELFDKGRECTIRLYADHCQVKFGDETFQRLYDGLWVTPKAGANTGAPAADDKLVGTWEAAKTKDFPYDVSIQFTKDGKMKMTVKAAKPIVREGTYTHRGDTIHITRSEGGKEEKDDWTIKSLDDKKLVIVDDRGTRTEYKRK